MEVGEPRHFLLVGTALTIAKQQQIDFHVGVGLSSAAMDHFVGVGYSFRFQAIRRECRLEVNFVLFQTPRHPVAE